MTGIQAAYLYLQSIRTFANQHAESKTEAIDMKRTNLNYSSPLGKWGLNFGLTLLILCFGAMGQLLAQPVIHSFSPESGPIGTEVTITGESFAVNGASTVYFGGAKAKVISASSTEIVMEVPAGASYHPLSVHTYGNVVYAAKPFQVVFGSDGTIASSGFDAMQTWTAGDRARFSAHADLDGDGLLDIIVSNENDKNLSVFRNTSSGQGNIDFTSDDDLDLISFEPNHVIVADFDGDEKLDIVTANSNGEATLRNLTILTNNSTAGDISMSNSFNTLLNNPTPAIAANDLNADGKVDLIVLDSINNEVIYLENTSSASLTFASGVSLAAGDRPSSLATADIDQDGLPDLVVTNWGDKSVSVLRNTSTGGTISFATKQDFTFSGSVVPAWVAVGDVDNDGAPDIVVNNIISIGILKNQSTGTISFAAPQNIDITAGSGVNLTDLNGDGWVDVLYKSFNSLGILKNLSSVGMPSFSEEIVLLNGFGTGGHNPITVSGADFDGDGEPEIVATASSSTGGFFGGGTTIYHLDILRNLGSGTDILTFSIPEQTGPATIDFDAHTIDLEVSDVPDLTNLVATFTTSSRALPNVGGINPDPGITSLDYTNPVTFTVYAEDGSTIQNWIVTVTLGCRSDEVTETVEACDNYEFDGQLLGNTGIYTATFLNTAGCDSVVTLDLTLQPTVYQDHVYTVGSYDFEGATLDVSGQYEYGPFTRPSGCDSTYVLNLSIEPDTYDPQDILRFEQQPISMINVTGSNHLGDLDGDGDLDVLVIGALKILDYDVAIYLNNGDGTFTEKGNSGIANDISGRSNRSRLVDMDGDGDLDFLTAGFNEATNPITRLFLNDGTGNFTKKEGLGLPTLEDAALDHADVDGDGDQDVVMIGSNGANDKAFLYLNDGNAVFTKASDTEFIGAFEGSVDFGDLDGDGDQDLFITGDSEDTPGSDFISEIYLNDGAGNFQRKINQPFFKTEGTAAEIIDLDGDGDLDIFASGDGRDFYNNRNSIIYLNDGNANFSRDTSSDIPEIGDGDVEFADLDNDGDPDMFISGRIDEDNTLNFEITSRVYLNNGFGHFSELSVCSLLPLKNTSVSIGDLNGDGLQDLVANGTINDGLGTDTTLVFFNALAPNDLVVEATGSYDFDGATLTSSGNYQGVFSDESGCAYPVNLDLTIIPFVGEAEYANVSFELVQPAGSPKIGLDLPKGIRGNNHIYDMDGDGDQDVLYFAVSPGGEYKLLAYLNDGAGNYSRVDQEHDFEFDVRINLPIVRIGDLNNDGINDLIIGGEPAGASAVIDLGTKVYFGDSKGQLHFQSGIQLSTSQIGDVRIQDFNVDGFPDIFIVHRSETFLYINDGLGNFTEVPTTGMNNGLALTRLAVSAPYNGGVDIMVTDFDMGFVNVIYRYESGMFTEVSRGFTTLSNFFHRFDFADANADGYPDILFLDSEVSNLYLNDQSGNYVLDTSNDFDGITNKFGSSLHFEDLNNDNAAEVVFGKASKELAVFWNDGSGGYGSHQAYTVNEAIGELTIGDLNGDGFPDILNNGQDQSGATADEWITRIYLNTQVDAFEAAELNITTEVRDGDLALFDANGDGHNDIIISGGYFENRRSTTELYTNDGTGVFTEVLTHPFEGLDYASIAVADLNGDDHEDLLLSGQNLSNEISTELYWNDGTGNFTVDVANNLTEVLGEVVILDANGDDVPDLLVVGEDDMGNGIADLYLGDGLGNFIDQSSGMAGWLDPEIAVGDVDDDDDIDVLIVGVDANEVERAQLYLNDGDGNFTDDPMFTAGAFNTGAVLLADLDSDDDLDIYLSGNGQFAIYENDGSGTFTLKHHWEGPYRSAATIGDIDDDGDADIIESGNWESTTGEPRTFVYFNDGNADFTKASIGALHGIFDGALALGDIDGDLDLDLMLSGGVHDPVTSSSRLYRNNSPLVTRVTQNVEVCDSYTFFGQVLSESGRYENTTTNADNSRTITTLNLTITEVPVEELEVAVCERYEWHDEIYTESGEYEVQTTGDDSCPVLQKLSLTILTPTESEETVEVCESYEWNGKTYTASGTYQELLTNAAGCDSTATLQLTILEPTDGFMEVGACGNYVWEGEEYTESGTYQKTLINAAGCDSLATLDLTILFASLSLEIAQACDSYEWGGATYTESGSYEVLLTNKSGCDSTATLNLTLQESSTGEASVESCGSYDWQGVTYDVSGSYETILTNSVGCDSIATLNLTVLPAPTVELEVDGDGLTLTEITVGDTYQWYDCITNLPIVGASEPTFEPSADGEYFIEVSNGLCTVTSLCAEATMLVTSVEDFSSPLVRLYPNPTSAHLNIELGQFYEDLKVEVMDLTGRGLEDFRAVATDQLTLDVSRWSGVIMIKISTSEEVVLQSRVLVR